MQARGRGRRLRLGRRSASGLLASRGRAPGRTALQPAPCACMLLLGRCTNWAPGGRAHLQAAHKSPRHPAAPHGGGRRLPAAASTGCIPSPHMSLRPHMNQHVRRGWQSGGVACPGGMAWHGHGRDGVFQHLAGGGACRILQDSGGGGGAGGQAGEWVASRASFVTLGLAGRSCACPYITYYRSPACMLVVVIDCASGIEAPRRRLWVVNSFDRCKSTCSFMLELHARCPLKLPSEAVLRAWLVGVLLAFVRLPYKLMCFSV